MVYYLDLWSLRCEFGFGHRAQVSLIKINLYSNGANLLSQFSHLRRYLVPTLSAGLKQHFDGISGMVNKVN
jgi:hypothetical protein